MFLLVCLLSCTGCKPPQMAGQETSVELLQVNDLAEYLTEENGMQYLILPISKAKVHVWEEHKECLDNIDIDLLKMAEDKMSSLLLQYENNSGFCLRVDKGALWLGIEVIESIEPPVSSEYGEEGCGIDHEHQYFWEQITK